MNESANKNDIQIINEWLGTGSINIFGRPFSGKDTQGNRLVKLLDAKLIGGGDIIRQSNDIDVKEIVDKGNLAPQEYFLAMMLPYLEREEFKGFPLILSSLGRWHGEEEPILKTAEKAGHPVKVVITLTIQEDVVQARWRAAQNSNQRGNRRDDDEEHVATRMSEYRNKTIPVLNFYRSRNILIEVDGTQSPDSVTRDIIQGLLAVAKQ